MLWDPYGRSETCETMLVYMSAKTCDAFGTAAALHKKGDPKGEERDAHVGISDEFGVILISLVLIA